MLTTKELQGELRIGRDTAYALMHSKGFPSMKLGGRYYVDEDALRKWIEQHAYKAFVL